MTALLTVLPGPAAPLVKQVAASGAVPVLDLTSGGAPDIARGCWIRAHPSGQLPGTGPVILTTPGLPVPKRPTWLETTEPVPIPEGFAGLVLVGGSALQGNQALEKLGRCNEPGRVMLRAALTPTQAVQARAMGCAGIVQDLGALVGAFRTAITLGATRTLHPDARASRPTLPSSFTGRRPVCVPRPAPRPVPIRGRGVRVIGEGPLADEVRAAVKREGGHDRPPWQAVVDLTVDPIVAFEAAREHNRHRPHRWCTVTRIGAFERARFGERTMLDGGRAGLAKALQREWPGTLTRVVDVTPELDDHHTARAVLAELFATDPVDEVFWDREGRKVVELQDAPLPPAGALPDRPLILITGGGRGVGARIALELARRGPVRLALVGRGAVANEPLDLQLETRIIKSSLKELTGRASPREVERRLSPLRRSEELRRNIGQLEAAGAQVQYFRADLAEPRAVARLLSEVRQTMGEPDWVIHGAGEADGRPLADKDPTTFRRVFDGKARGGLALLGQLPPSTPVVTLGSVAGRTGQAGQVDEAAAHEALARICLARPGGLHLACAPWDDVGMSVRGTQRSVLMRLGVELLPADAGAGLVVDWLAYGATGERVVAGELGAQVEGALEHPMVSRVDRGGARVRLHSPLTPEAHPWMGARAPGDTLLPLGIVLELMAAAATQLAPGAGYGGIQQASVLGPLMVSGHHALQAVVEAEMGPDGQPTCRLTLAQEDRVGRAMAMCTATVRLALEEPPEGLPAAFLPDEPLDATAIYDRLSRPRDHQVLKGVQGIAQDGLLAEVGPLAPASGLLSEPRLVEAALQALELHHLACHGTRCRLQAIDALHVIRAPEAEESVVALVRWADGQYDVDVDGRTPLLRLRGIRVRGDHVVPPHLRVPEPPGGRPGAFPPSGTTTP